MLCTKHFPRIKNIHNHTWKCQRGYVSLKDAIFGDLDGDVYQPSATASDSNHDFPRSRKLKGRFVSPWSHLTEKRFKDVMKYLATRKQIRMTTPEISDTRTLINSVEVDRVKMRSITNPHATWLGHATCHYQTEGVFFLTDPVWSNRAAPIQFAGPERFIKPALEVEDVKVDVVLLSHTHYDHLDANTAKRIGNKALWVVPLGVKELLRGMGVTNCIELDWWQSHNYQAPSGRNIEILFAPSKHWTARGVFDRNTCLWGSFAVLSPQSKFYFTGDTAYCDLFRKIGATFGPFDLAAVPIGAYAPRWFMKDVHCNPEEAVRIHQDLQAKQSMAVHWGTFPMADEDYVEPALELARARDVLGVPSHSFFTVAHGETVDLLCKTSAKLGIAPHKPITDFATKYPDVYGIYLDQLRTGVMKLGDP